MDKEDWKDCFIIWGLVSACVIGGVILEVIK